MRKGYGAVWRRLGRIEKAFLVFAAVYALLYFTRAAPTMQSLAALGTLILGLLALFKLARRGMRKAIWRLRNRLIVAYLFIAVVPIILILALAGIAGYAVIGQMAVYLVNTELSHRMNGLMRPAEALAHAPIQDPATTINRFVPMIQNGFPQFELRIAGHNDARYPPESRLEPPPPAWKRASGLIVKKDGKEDRLYAWAHEVVNGNEVTILAPVTHELLAGLVPKLGDANLVPFTKRGRENRVPGKVSALDFAVAGVVPLQVASWDSPSSQTDALLLVNSRVSAVLGMVFGEKLELGEGMLAFFVAVAILFLIVETFSAVAGIQLSRSMTGAVHELYEGTQHVKVGDFSYRIPVKGNDQLAELSASFNTMTENLGQLIVVAKEKERLESELEIAREVQSQLFPKDVPYVKTLELKGVCSPARVVSGDYYDFMQVSDGALAFAIGDVAGKGISAALLMATIQSAMRSQLSTSNGSGLHRLSTATMVSNLNQQLYATTSLEKYATFYFALYNESTHALTYTNAGHLPPMLLRGNDIQTMDSTGTVVGAFPFATYEEKTVPLEHGDILLAYTDGIVEPENVYGEVFGEDRLKDLLIKHAHADSSELIARTMEAVVQWTGSSELQDDMTMVVARRI
ncbi:MAG: SpoIIE family protein phosphatase [Bryobacteraceae bacterium]|jgi:sigma-B regulation protein RsbU (phosphoserine phosphatase)